MRVHLALAQLAAAQPTSDPEFLATHYLAAVVAADTGRHFAAAAKRASSALAFERAAELYHSALECSPDDNELRVQLAEALANAGRAHAAASTYIHAAELSTGPAALDLRRLGAMYLIFGGSVDAGVQEITRVFSSLDIAIPQSPRRALASLRLRQIWLRLRGLRYRERAASSMRLRDQLAVDACWSCALGLTAIDPIVAAAIQTKGLLLALRTGDRARIARALSLEAIHCGLGSTNSRRSNWLVSLSRKAAVDPSTEHLETTSIVAECVIEYLRGNWGKASALGRRGEARLLQGTGVVSELRFVRLFIVAALANLGELRQLTDCARGYIQTARDSGDLYSLASIGTSGLPLVRMAEDRPQLAHEELADILSRWSQAGFHVPHSNAMFRTSELYLYDNQYDMALRTQRQLMKTMEASLLKRLQIFRIFNLDLLARCLLTVRRASTEASLLKEVDKIAARIERERVTWGSALAAQVRAGTARAANNYDEARSQLETAQRLFAASGMALHAAAARTRLGQLLSGDEGERLVTEATAWMTSQGVNYPARMTALLAPGFDQS